MSESRPKNHGRGQPQIKRHGDGIYSKWNRTREEWVYYVQYWWQPPGGLRKKRISEQVPRDNDGKCRLKTARKIAAQRDRDRLQPDFLPPHVEKRQKRGELQREEDARRPLLFDVASERFLGECAEEYSRPKDTCRRFRSWLSLAFEGRYLHEITKQDIHQYHLDRLRNQGPFKGRRVRTRRAADVEITALSALYAYMQENGYEDLENPCHSPRTRRKKKGALKPYKPLHKPIIPNLKHRKAIFAAATTLELRAFLTLCYYTAGRPESEPCRLTHGDVELVESAKVQTLYGAPVLSRLRYRDTKTGDDRTIRLHPEAEVALRAIMLPRPEGGPALEIWKLVPIFRKRASVKPWDRSSYRKGWSNTLKTVCVAHPELAGMWVRDFRSTARTVMTDAGVPEVALRRVLGHSVDVSGGYYRVTEDMHRKAILALGPVQFGAAAQHLSEVAR